MRFDKAGACGLLSICLLVAGCLKIPDKLISPMIKIEPVIQDNKEEYRLRFSAGIQNDNGSTALLDVKGAVLFVDPEGGNRILSVPFEISAILPFETGVIESARIYPENEIMPLVNLLGSDREKLMKNKALERSFFDDKIVKVKISDYRTEGIISLLRNRFNEKH
jgi:hypothetical protein